MTGATNEEEDSDSDDDVVIEEVSHDAEEEKGNVDVVNVIVSVF